MGTGLPSVSQQLACVCSLLFHGTFFPLGLVLKVRAIHELDNHERLQLGFVVEDPLQLPELDVKLHSVLVALVLHG